MAIHNHIENNTFGQMFSGVGETVISGYFIGQMSATLLLGYRARRLSREQNEQSITFQQELNDLRQEFAKEKSQADLDFIRECHEKGMEFQRETAYKSCENRRQEDEFRKFCETSWLTHFRHEIGAVLEAMEQPEVDGNGLEKMKLLLARTPLVSDGQDRKGAYARYCQDFKDDYILQYSLNIDGLWLRAWERDCVSAMSDTMNLHYIMQGMPTMILFPIQRGDYLSLETATWGYQLGQTGVAFDKTFRVPMKEIDTDSDRLRHLLIAATAYIDDCYRVLLCQSSPDSIYKIKDCLQQDEFVWKLLCGKYQSLLGTVEQADTILLLKNNDVDELKKTIEL